MNRIDIEERLEKHSELFDLAEQVAERHTDLLLQVTRNCFDLLAEVHQQKKLIVAQGNLINQCMERIMTLEGRGVLGNFNKRLEELELHAIGPNFEWDCIRDRLDKLESYFQEEENKSGNSSFEEHEEYYPDRGLEEFMRDRYDC